METIPAVQQDVPQDDLSIMEQYEYLLGDLQSIRTEASFIARSVLTEAKYSMGKAIISSGLYQRHQRTGDNEPPLVKQLAEDLEVGIRNLYDIIRFAREADAVGGYESWLDSQGIGKEISWSKVKSLLATGGEVPDEDKPGSYQRGVIRANRKKALQYARKLIGKQFTEAHLAELCKLLAVKL
jgi:hypothetical protein